MSNEQLIGNFSMSKLRESIDSINENQLDAVLGNFGSKIVFKDGDRELYFRWPDQLVKQKLYKKYIENWSQRLNELKDTLPEELYQELKEEIKKEVKFSLGSVNIAKLVEWFTSGSERPLMLYILACCEQLKNEEEVIELLLKYPDDNNDNGISFPDFTVLHLARFLHVYLPGNQKKVILDFLKTYLKR